MTVEEKRKMTDFSKMKSESTFFEYEQMRKLKLFDTDQIESIKAVRRSIKEDMAKAKLRSRMMKMNIKYEKRILFWIRGRAKMDMKLSNPTHKKVIASIVGRIKLLYKEITTAYPANIKLWDQYIRFVLRNGYANEASAIIDEMLQENDSSPDVWVKAITYEHKYNENLDRATSLVAQAQNRHPDSLPIYCTYFKIVLDNKDKRKDIDVLAMAEAIFCDGMRRHENIKYYMEMLKIADQYKYTRLLQEMIASAALDRFKDFEEFWYLMGLRDLNQLMIVCKCGDQVKEEEIQRTKQGVCISCRDKQIYDGLNNCRKIGTSITRKFNTQKMYHYYLDLMFEMNKDRTNFLNYRIGLLKDAFKLAGKAKHLNEDYYCKFICALNKHNRDDPDVLARAKEGAKKYQRSAELWLLLIKYYIQRADFANTQEVYRMAKLALKPNPADASKIYMINAEFLTALPITERIDHFNNEFLTDVLNDTTDDAYIPFRIELLKLVNEVFDIESTRKLFRLIRPENPELVHLPLFEAMFDLQLDEVPQDEVAEKAYLKKLLRTFGSENVDVWIRSLQYDQSMKSDNSAEIIRKAKCILKTAELRDELDDKIKQYSKVISVSP